MVRLSRFFAVIFLIAGMAAAHSVVDVRMSFRG